MTRDRSGLISPHPDHARRHPGRSDTSRAVHTSNWYGPCKRVAGALSVNAPAVNAPAMNAPGNDLPFGRGSEVTTDIIGVSHGVGLSVLWTVLSVHRRQPRAL